MVCNLAFKRANFPNDVIKSLIHQPLTSRRMSPPNTLPSFKKTLVSILSFTKVLGGFLHLKFCCLI